MRKLILASVAVLGFAGVAAAQEAPTNIYGETQQSVTDNPAPSQVDRMKTASVRHSAKQAGTDSRSSDLVGPNFDINMNENYSGR